MKVIKQDLIIIFTALIVISVYIDFLVFAQRGPRRYKSHKDCMDNFDPKEALSDESFFEKFKFNKTSWLEYFSCRAAAKGDINECNNLDSRDSVADCTDHYNSIIGFYSILIYNKQITPELLKCCTIAGGDMKACRQFAKAFIENDVSVCKKNDLDCQAAITLNERLTHHQSAIYGIYFVKAIRDLNVDYCLKIKDKRLQRECQAYITGDIKICNESNEFKKIRNSYCQYCLQ